MIPDRSHFCQTGHLVVHIQKACDAPRGRSVEDDGVVGVGRLLLGAANHFACFAGQENISQAWCDRRGEIDSTHAAKSRSRAPEVVEDLEVIQECVFGVDSESPDLASPGSDGDLAFFVRKRWNIEQLSDSLTTLDLHQQCSSTIAGQSHRQRPGNRGLAGASLAGDNVQRHVRPEGGRHRSTLLPHVSATHSHRLPLPA